MSLLRYLLLLLTTSLNKGHQTLLLFSIKPLRTKTLGTQLTTQPTTTANNQSQRGINRRLKHHPSSQSLSLGERKGFPFLPLNFLFLPVPSTLLEDGGGSANFLLLSNLQIFSPAAMTTNDPPGLQTLKSALLVPTPTSLYLLPSSSKHLPSPQPLLPFSSSSA
jgi:hypothetical protein